MLNIDLMFADPVQPGGQLGQVHHRRQHHSHAEGHALQRARQGVCAAVCARHRVRHFQGETEGHVRALRTGHLPLISAVVGLLHMADPNGCRRKFALLPRLKAYPKRGALAFVSMHLVTKLTSQACI